MQTKAVTVKLQTLDGTWETVGVDRLRGVYPENDSYTADEFGSSKCSFDLRRDPGVQFPDITAYTPIEVEIGGRKLWSGRVLETPIREADRVVNVQGQGWQFHMDDDSYRRTYAHAKLGEYVDMRTVANAELGAARLNAAGTVSTDNGQIYIGWPNGAALTALCYVGVLLDLGERSTATDISIDWESSNNTSAFTLYARTSSTATNAGSTNSDAFTVAMNAGASGTTTGSFSGPQRYVQVFIYNPSFTGTAGADYYFKIKGARVFTSAAYVSSGVSVLKATQIIPDALANATVLLSPDLSGIDPNGTVSFAFPEFAMSDDRSAREVLTAANAVHDYQMKVDVDRRLLFNPKPSAPTVEIGAWAGSEFDDASANSGDDIYNRVKVSGTSGDGSALTVVRTSGQQTGVPLVPTTTPVADNPSFATNTTSWTPTSPGTITRDTGVFDSTPASGRWDRSGSILQFGDQLTETFTGTFRAGVPYLLIFRAKSTVAGMELYNTFGSSLERIISFTTLTTSFADISLSWTPTVDTSGTTLALQAGFGAAKVYVDSLQLFTALPTLVDRRGFLRTMILPVKCSITPALGKQIGDVWLAAHKTTPLKGSVKVSGNGGAREILTGASFAPERFLTMTGELLQLSHRLDPDTGGQARTGRIAEVTYTPETDEAVIALDSRRTSHEALLERLAVVVGGA